MTDKIPSHSRSRNMAAIKSKDTQPEMAVRRLVHALGYRFRLHASSLPGKPDLIFRQRRKLIFVHGCFWHLHPKADCLDSRLPKSNTSYWTPKLRINVARDERNMQALKQEGWECFVIWECETKDTSLLSGRLLRFLETGG